MTTTSIVTIPRTGSYTIDPTRSHITFTAKHLFGLGTVKGTFALRSGQLVVADPAEGSSATAVIDATSFTSGNPKRDEQVRSAKFLDGKTYPDITFTSTSVTLTDAGWTIEGRLGVHGTTAPVELHLVDVNVSGTDLRLTATTTVDRTTHAITAAKGMAGRYLQLQLDVVARRQLS